MEETIAHLKAGIKAKRIKSKEAIEEANNIAACVKTRCSCGARKNTHTEKCTRCKFIEQYSCTFDVEWASNVCIQCRKRDARVDNKGVRLTICEHCSSVNKMANKNRTERCIANRVCVNCGGKHGPLVTKRLCEHCRSTIEKAKPVTPRIKKIANFSSAVNKLCDDILEIDKMHELANQIKELVARLTVKK